MSWFFETRTYSSEKNGPITVRREFGTWQVTVDTCEQTGSYLAEMWDNAFRTISTYLGVERVRRVLMLGLGAGGEIKRVWKHFSGSELTVIEHDPVMIGLAKKLKIYRPAPFPTVIEGDAAQAVHALRGQFDVIILDMFKGREASPLSSDPEFLSALNERLAPQGLMLVNVYRNAELLDSIGKRFMPFKLWRFWSNHLGLFGQSAVREAFAQGFLPSREWPEMSSLNIMRELHAAPAGKDGRGVYWRFGPFSFEKYYGDEEPVLHPLPRGKRTLIRTVMWQRLFRSDVPKGWVAFSDLPEHKIGFAPTAGRFEADWSESARRSARMWRDEFLGKKYVIEEVPFETYAAAQKRSTLPTTIKGPFLSELRLRLMNPDTPVTHYAVKNKDSGTTVAGLAVIWSTSSPSAYYHGGFYHRSVRREPVMEGLFSHWYGACAKRGVRYVDFGGFWYKGADASWKGLSRFKAKFNPLYFFYPPVLYRFELNLPWTQKS